MVGSWKINGVITSGFSSAKVGPTTRRSVFRGNTYETWRNCGRDVLCAGHIEQETRRLGGRMGSELEGVASNGRQLDAPPQSRLTLPTKEGNASARPLRLRAFVLRARSLRVAFPVQKIRGFSYPRPRARARCRARRSCCGCRGWDSLRPGRAPSARRTRQSSPSGDALPDNRDRL